MPSTRYNTITLSAPFTAQTLEGIAFEEIFPGQMCDLTDDLGTDIYTRQKITDAKVPTLIAIENRWEGKTVLDSYVADERIYMRWFRPGDLFLGLVAAGTSFEKGDHLRNNDGFFVPDAVESRCSYISWQDTSAGPSNKLIKISVL
jgi:hypothetical protein